MAFDCNRIRRDGRNRRVQQPKEEEELVKGGWPTYIYANRKVVMIHDVTLEYGIDRKTAQVLKKRSEFPWPHLCGIEEEEGRSLIGSMPRALFKRVSSIFSRKSSGGLHAPAP